MHFNSSPSVPVIFVFASSLHEILFFEFHEWPHSLSRPFTLLNDLFRRHSMRFVNQFDVKFLSEAALFDRLFQNLTGLPLLDAEV